MKTSQGTSLLTKTARATWTIYLILIITVIIWGVAWPVGRLLAVGLPPVSIAAIRYTVVVPVLFFVLWLKERSVRLPRDWVWNLAFLGILSVTLYQAFFLFGVRYAAASDDSLVIGIAPVMVAVLAAFVVKEPLTGMKVAGLLSGLSGIAMISFLSPNVDVSNRFLGVSLVFGGAVAYALHTVYLRKFVKNENPNSLAHASPSSLAIATWVSFFGWVFLIPFSLLESPWNYAWELSSWGGILYLALLSSVIGYFFFVEAVSQIGASRTAIFGNLIPVFGVLSSALLLNEAVNIWHGASFLLILLGVVLANRKAAPVEHGPRIEVADTIPEQTA